MHRQASSVDCLTVEASYLLSDATLLEAGAEMTTNRYQTGSPSDSSACFHKSQNDDLGGQQCFLETSRESLQTMNHLQCVTHPPDQQRFHSPGLPFRIQNRVPFSFGRQKDPPRLHGPDLRQALQSGDGFRCPALSGDAQVVLETGEPLLDLSN
jgi:hypothetical protein